MSIKRSVVGLGMLAIALSAPLGVTKDKGKGKWKDKGRWEHSDRGRRNRDYAYDRDRFFRRDSEHIKHRGMDRNGDGVITREEWRGNENSFRRQDRNGDGVLSGREVRPGARGRGNGRGRWK